MNYSKKYLIFAFLSLMLLVLAFFYGNPYPSDFDLEQRFAKNKTDFEKLVFLFQKNANLERVNEKGEVWLDFDTKTKLSQQKSNNYKELLEKLNIQEIRRYKSDSDFYLQVYRTSNLIIGSKTKSYVFTKTEPEKVVSSLDKLVLSTQDTNVYKKIDENWYLHLDIW